MSKWLQAASQSPQNLVSAINPACNFSKLFPSFGCQLPCTYSSQKESVIAQTLSLGLFVLKAFSLFGGGGVHPITSKQFLGAGDQQSVSCCYLFFSMRVRRAGRNGWMGYCPGRRPQLSLHHCAMSPKGILLGAKSDLLRRAYHVVLP